MEQSWATTVLGKVGIGLVVIIVLLVAVIFLFPKQTENVPSLGDANEPKLHTSMGQLQVMWWGNDTIQIFHPLPNDTITSRTIQVNGKARGNWFFEASAPVHIIDASGKTVLSFPMMTIGDWMTTELVDFSGEGKLTAPIRGEGWIVFEKDNPSGLPEYAQEIRIPISFDVK